APHLEGFHGLEELGPPPERTCSGGSAELVRGEAEEVTAERLYVHGPMWNGLCCVDDHERALLVRPGGQTFDRIDRPERVRDPVRGDHLDRPHACELVQ